MSTLNKFFATKNIETQCHQLEHELNIRNNKESKRKWRKFLLNQMHSIYDKYGNRKPKRMRAEKFIDLLNKKSIYKCKSIYYEKKRNNMAKRSAERPGRSHEQRQISDLERQREYDMHGKREQYVSRRPEYTGMESGKVTSGLSGYSDGNGMSGFATIPKGKPGEEYGFITASGETGDQMRIGSNNTSDQNPHNNLEDKMQRLV